MGRYAAAMSVIPMAIFGGVLGLLISGIPFSVSAAIGSSPCSHRGDDGIIILSQYNQLIDEGFDRVKAVIRTGELQLRPVLMTCVVAGVGAAGARRPELDRRCRSRSRWSVVTGNAGALVILGRCGADSRCSAPGAVLASRQDRLDFSHEFAERP